METNGIIRRVDNLGRVVIPREFRKLHKIALGDPMEITCKANGEIVLRKIDMTHTLVELAQSAVKLLAMQLGGTVIVSNLTEFISGSGADKSRFIGAKMDSSISALVQDRRSMVPQEVKPHWNLLPSGEKRYIMSEPIVGESDVFGALFFVSTETPDDVTVTAMLKITAGILGTSLQKY